MHIVYFPAEDCNPHKYTLSPENAMLSYRQFSSMVTACI